MGPKFSTAIKPVVTNRRGNMSIKIMNLREETGPRYGSIIWEITQLYLLLGLES